MNKWREILLVVIILILLIMAATKSSAGAAATSVTSKLLDPNTGIPIGLPGIRNSSVGAALTPFGNNSTNSEVSDYAKNPTTPLCPVGYSPVIDPDTSGIYCVLPQYLSVNPV